MFRDINDFISFNAIFLVSKEFNFDKHIWNLFSIVASVVIESKLYTSDLRTKFAIYGFGFLSAFLSVFYPPAQGAA